MVTLTKMRFLLKAFDALVGRFLFLFLPDCAALSNLPLQKARRILIIRPGGIGDFILLGPALDALRAHFTGVEIDVLCERRNAAVGEIFGYFRKIYLYDRGVDLIRCLRCRYDIVVDTEQWHRLSALVAYLTGAAVRVGFNTNSRGKVFSCRIGYSQERYEVLSFIDLMEPLVGKKIIFDPDKPFLSINERVLPAFCDNVKGSTAAIFVGASVKERLWATDNFRELALRLFRRGVNTVLLGSRADCARAGAIGRGVDGCLDLAGKLPLSQTAAMIKKSMLFVSVDSGLLHLAYGMGVPTVSLFGAGIRKKWAPPGRQHIVLDKNLPCSPCTRFGYTPRCRKGVVCLELITVDEVMAAVDTQLDRVQHKYG